MINYIKENKMNINHYTKIFIKNIMLGAGNVHLSLANHDHVLLAVEKAYIAMQPRTFEKLISNAKINIAAKKAVLKDLANKFVDYFKAPAPTTQADFDKWHKDTCDWFLDEFNKKVMRPSGYKDISYGKAQKIVNVTFKFLYLYCDIVPGTPGHFTFCHFIIDRYTLIWYKDVVCKKLGTTPPKKPWRDMDYPEYIEIQYNTRKYLGMQEEYSQNPFLAEFEIWSEYAFEKNYNPV